MTIEIETKLKCAKCGAEFTDEDMALIRKRDYTARVKEVAKEMRTHQEKKKSKRKKKEKGRNTPTTRCPKCKKAMTTWYFENKHKQICKGK